MTGLVLRLAVGRGPSALLRMVLVVLAAGFSSALLLTAVGLVSLDRSDLAISGSSGTATYADGTVETFDEPGSAGPITNDYLVQPGLRNGVAIGFVLCVVPLLVFLGTASRVAVRRRDERLAGLRLAGATDGQVRALAALDAAVGGAAGAALGTALFLGTRGVVLASADGQVRAIAVALLPPLLPAIGVLLLLLVGVSGAAAIALRAVLITPLGVVRRAPRRRPRPWSLLALVIGLVGFAATVARPPGQRLATVLVSALLVLMLLGLVSAGTWLTSLTGRAAGRIARGPALLLAGRRLEDEPRAQARAMSAVVLVTLSATIALVILRDFQTNNGADSSFYGQGFALAAVGMVFSLVVAAAGLLLTTLEGLLERRRTLASLTATGVPTGTLARAVLLQVGLPVLPAAVLAVLVGLATTGALAGSEGLATPWTVLLLPPAAVLACVAATACTLPALRRAADVEQLRVP